MGLVTWELSIDVIWDQSLGSCELRSCNKSLGSCELRSYGISHLGVVN